MSAKLYVDEKVIRPRHLMQKLGICRKTIHNWIDSGVLPKPRHIGPQMVGWYLSDLEDFYKSMDKPE